MKQHCKNAQVAVKWENGTWTYYKSKKGRDFLKVANVFRQSSNFRMLIIYEMADDWKGNDHHASRGNKLFYADKYKSESF